MQLLFPLQRCLDTSPRESGPQVLSTVCLCNKRPLPDRNSFKNTLESTLVIPKRKKGLFWLWNSYVGKNKKPLCGKKWMSHNMHSCWLTHYLSGFCPSCMAPSLLSPMWITAIAHMPVALVIECVGQWKVYMMQNVQRLGFWIDCSWAACLTFCQYSLDGMRFVCLFVLKNNVCNWLINNIDVWIYEVWSPEYEAMNKLVGFYPCGFFYKVHHFMWAKSATSANAFIGVDCLHVHWYSLESALSCFYWSTNSKFP